MNRTPRLSHRARGLAVRKNERRASAWRTSRVRVRWHAPHRSAAASDLLRLQEMTRDVRRARRPLIRTLLH
eukprot:6195404-Pleurochrysis_carterae.AAC.1